MTIEQYLQKDVYSNPINNPNVAYHTYTNAAPAQQSYGVPYAHILELCLLVAIIGFIIYLILRILALRDLLHQKTVFLELTPPAFAKKTPMATEQLFNTLYTLGMSMPLRDRLKLRSNIFSFEVVSSRSQGIRYLVRLGKSQRATFQQQLAAYLPDVRFQLAKDYIPKALEANNSISLTEFTQRIHYAYPLASHDVLTQHDPIAYITGSMTKLQPDELIAFQIVLSPAQPREAKAIRNKLLAGKSPSLTRKVWSWPLRLIRFVFRLAFGLLWGLLGADKRHSRPAYSTQAPTPAAQAVINSIHGKLNQPLFRASIRTVVITEDNTRRAQSATAIASSLGAFSVPGYQSLVTKRSFPHQLVHRYHWLSFHNRLPALLHSSGCVLSLSEIASLYHFPYGDTSRPENLVTSHSRTLPAPVSLKRNADNNGFDVMLGENQHHGSNTPIGLTSAERERHIYVIGGTGNGKTTLLQYAIAQDIQAGKGVAVIDPHGDLATTLLKHVPKARIKDVIYVNPVDIEYPIGINLLELPTGLDANGLLLEKGRVTEAAVSVLRKVFGDGEANAHRIEGMLRNAIHTAFTVEGATLFTVLKLLRNKDYRNAVVAKLDDEDLKDFWKGEFSAAGEWQRVSMSKGLTARIDRFNSDAPARRMFEQAKSTINFENILDSGKILICNFAEGEIGDDTSALFGTTILAKLKLAAERRARMAETERRPFYVYVDEFQNFATTPFVKMLSSARKYKLFLTIAQQSTAQQEQQRLTEAILANVATVVCFRTGSPVDERLLLPRFSPYIERGEIGNLPAYNFYIRIQALESLEPLSGVTVVLQDTGSPDIANKVIAASRTNYATKYVVPPKPKRKTSDDDNKQDERIKPESDI